MRLRPTLLAGMGGALLAYLFDPQAGARRRHRMASQAAGTMRARRRGMSKRGEYLAGRSKGMVRELRPDQQPENAQTLVDKVRSEVLGAEQWRHYTVNVSAADGVVMLNGQLDRPEQIERLVHEVRQVTGVRDVENALHLPGTLPPNKRSAMTARVR
ncbi:MAG TPA: BON domain-containing protein [Egibacteraceae bacterium]|nr:BON domain-containing protein [Egibacteraceae bacterium]